MLSCHISPKNLSRSLYITLRCYCEKTVYQRLEEGEKERTVYGKPYPDWRKPWIKRKGEFTSKLDVFVEKNPSPDILNTLNRIPDMNWKTVTDWWASMKDIQERVNQKYMIQRIEMLGSNLAAMHFFTFRGASVRLRNANKWLEGDPMTALSLPSRFEEGYFVEAVDCSNFKGGIRYEGIENLLNLSSLKWLSLRNSKHIDTWCIDRLAGQNGKSLEYLDLSGCNLNVTWIYGLARMTQLKYLVVTDPGDNIELQAALSILETENPNLKIKAIRQIENTK